MSDIKCKLRAFPILTMFQLCKPLFRINSDIIELNAGHCKRNSDCFGPSSEWKVDELVFGHCVSVDMNGDGKEVSENVTWFECCKRCDL